MLEMSTRPELAPGTIGLRVDGESIRLDGSRITLDLIVEEYERGTTPLEMVQKYEVLSLFAIRRAIKYYLDHRQEVLAYLQQRKEKADALRAANELRQKPFSPETLLAMKAMRENLHASGSQ